eukprot:366212-Chlamydomonas_euryale.AAC.47
MAREYRTAAQPFRTARLPTHSIAGAGSAAQDSREHKRVRRLFSHGRVSVDLTHLNRAAVLALAANRRHVALKYRDMEAFLDQGNGEH